MKHITEAADSDLIAGVLQGSEQAFATLMARYQDRVFRLLSRYCRDPEECQDLAQDVFVKVFRKLHTFQQDSAFFTWLFRIAVNTATDYLSRASRRRLRLVEDDAELDGQTGDRRGDNSSTEQPVLDAELAEVTRLVLARLPEKYRTILVLREYEDLSYTEMAQVLDCNLGTVESRLFRARQRFKEALERLYPDLVPGRNSGAGRAEAADPRGGSR
ncbi:MAG: sigma-70 family RNA polymerase sigma factor [Planctomycetes bacterium]|nr:sigma-70 family RNA polymerase sigma factor [Planctomycetota bacterium]